MEDFYVRRICEVAHKRMSVLQIACNISNTKVYSNLVKELDRLGVGQVVFNPIRKTKSDHREE